MSVRPFLTGLLPEEPDELEEQQKPSPVVATVTAAIHQPFTGGAGEHVPAAPVDKPWAPFEEELRALGDEDFHDGDI